MIQVIYLRTRYLIVFLFLSLATSVFATDDVIEVRNIIAGDSYLDGSISPKNLINMVGVTPNPPTDVSVSTYGIVGWDCWHTSGNDNSKAWLLLDIGDVLPVSQIYIWNLNQYSNSDRDIKDITILYSSDSSDGENGTWHKLGDYVIPQGPGNGSPCTPQSCLDLNKTVRFVKIQAKSSYGSPYWGLGKIILVQDHSMTGSDAIVDLKLLYKRVSALNSYEFTGNSWSDFSYWKEEAKELIDNLSNDEDQINNVFSNLKKASEALVKKENLAISCKVLASSFYSAGYEPQNAVDGKFSTRWAVSDVNNLFYQIDLGSAKSFNQVAIFESEAYSGRIDKVIISVSQDGSIWEKWDEKEAKFAYISVVSKEMTARYIKIEFLDCSPEGLNIDEIMVFNDASAKETEDPIAWREDDISWIKQESGISPNKYQKRKANLKYGMFIHYGINTFLGQEWTDGSHPASAYNPDLSTLDPEAWVKVAYEGGMNFVVLVAKHHEGFALWNTSIGMYNINNTGRDGDKRDIVKEVSDACRKYGIKFGLYYSAWDRNWDLNNTTAITGLDRVALCQKYNDFALAQINELMDGRYGEISEFWIDGAWVKINKAWEFSRMYNLVKSLQPTCQMGINCTIRGVTPDKLQGGDEMYFFPSDFRLQDPMFTRPGADADPKVYKYNDKDYYLPFEATICINNSWFWTDKQNEASVISADKIRASYNHMVEQGNTLVVNLAPGSNGLLNEFDVKGLYDGARALGIARGDARTDKQQGECAVRIDFVTNNGYIAAPSKYIYGQEGAEFRVDAEDLRCDGYELQSKDSFVLGSFTKKETVVTFIYDDKGNATSSSKKIEINNGLSIQDGNIVICNDMFSEVNVYTATGLLMNKVALLPGTNTIDVRHLKGMYIVNITDADTSKSVKMLIP